ncbi:unnamed protein product [Urochloa humidicola]
MRTLVIAVTLLQLAAAATVAAPAANVARPGCQSKCGELDIPYPFGTTAGCYRPGFKVTCDPKPGAGVAQILKLMNGDGPAVLEISVANSTVRIRSSTWFFAVGNTSMERLAVVPGGGPYVLSPKRNHLIHIGCGFNVSLWTAAPSTRAPPPAGKTTPGRSARLGATASAAARFLSRRAAASRLSAPSSGGQVMLRWY